MKDLNIVKEELNITTNDLNEELYFTPIIDGKIRQSDLDNLRMYVDTIEDTLSCLEETPEYIIKGE
jgi:hypothetical protein